MPPKANPDQANGAKMVSADCVSVLLMASGNTSISRTQYDMMSALDGTRTASSFQHQFRSILQKAKELKTRQEAGEEFVPVEAARKRGAAGDDGDTATPPYTPKKAKGTTKGTPKAASKAASNATTKGSKKGGEEGKAVKQEPMDELDELDGAFV